jgi:carboxyl-terminal processing protease
MQGRARSRRDSDYRRGYITGLAAGALAAAAVALGIVWLTGGFEAGSGAPTDARNVIEQNYFRSVKGSVLDNASVNGMINEVKKRYHDRFSHYFNPHQLRQFDSSTSGHFSGVGLTVTAVKRGLGVASVLPHSPAQAAGIKEGEVITAVDGHSISRIPEQVAVARIKGPPGTPVTLRVVSVGGGTREVHLKRADVQVPAATGDIKRAGTTKVAYVRYSTFSEGSHGDLSTTLERLYRQGAKGLVLDLRGNGGGLLNEAVLSASLFLKKGQRVVSTNSRTMGHRTYDAVGNPLQTVPTVVLIDHNTASAAEILASALADHHLATIVGTRSFGKGTFQEVIRLAAGGALDLTVGEYLTADNVSLAGKGIPPDIKARDNPKTHPDEALNKALAVLAETAAVQNR